MQTFYLYLYRYLVREFELSPEQFCVIVTFQSLVRERSAKLTIIVSRRVVLSVCLSACPHLVLFRSADFHETW